MKLKYNSLDYSIIDILESGNPARNFRICVLEQIKADKSLHFDEGVNLINNEYFAELEDDSDKFNIDELYTSPKWKRALRQTEKVVDEIVSIVNKDRKDKADWVYPTNIFIETTRTEDIKEESKPRKKQIEKMLSAMVDDYKKYQKACSLKEDEAKQDKKSLSDELKEFGNELADLRYLYFLQEGKCLYSGKALHIDSLSQECELDHIIPESKGGSDSILSNRALVLKKENQDKRDVYPVPSRIQNDRSSWWEHLKRIGAINEAKYQALTSKSDVDARQKSKFAMRQLTATSQIIKFASDMLELKFSDKGTKIVKIRAGFVSKIRERYNFPKVRSLNNLHHAHDAYLVCLAGLFMQKRYPILSDENFWFRNLLEERDNFIDPVRAFGNDYLPNSNSLLQEWNFTKLEKMIENDLYCKDVFVSRYSGNSPDSASFWKETLISPDCKDSNGNSLNLKNVLKSIDGIDPRTEDNRLDAEKYGGNNKLNYSLTVPVLYNGVMQFVGITSIDLQTISNRCSLEELIRARVNAEGSDADLKILRKRVFIYNKFGSEIEFSGKRWVVGGFSNGGKYNVLIGALEPVFTFSFLDNYPGIVSKYISGYCCDNSTLGTLQRTRCSYGIMHEIYNYLNGGKYDHSIVTQEVLNSLYFEIVFYLISNHFMVLETEIKKHYLIAGYEKFKELDLSEKCGIITDLSELGNSESVNLSKVGGPKCAERARKGMSEIADKITFVDKSVTGMYENRTDCSKWLEK